MSKVKKFYKRPNRVEAIQQGVATDDEIREFIGRPCSIEGLPAGYWVVKFDPQDIRFVSPEIFEAIYQEDSKGMIIEPTAPKGETDA